ncbi:hypothetical protein H5410_041022 [Solanum commersonii]|uniref:Uncharacterized protein n=1 Tax=Solanum commersonii TaxID=4109 RepID=A0A9J5XT93_SOLCO|nr:hypothetical protein H5410_041022 [Solanum commersonii]
MASHPYNTRSKGKNKMAYKDGNESDNDKVRNQMTSQETVSTEEVRTLRQQMAEMYEAWTSGQAPSSSIHDYLNTNMTPSIQVSTNDPIYPPGFGPYTNTSNVAGTSTVRPLSALIMSNPLFMPTMLTNSIPNPTMVPKSKNDLHPMFFMTMATPLKRPLKFQALIPRLINIVLISKWRRQWREQAARVKPPMKELEMIDVFLQAQEPDYFHYLLSAVGKTFSEVIKVGEMVENGIKSGKIPILAPSYLQWRAPLPQNHPPPPQIHQNTIRIPFRPRREYKRGNGAKDEFTPIGELYASFFKKLWTLNVLSPIERKMSNPPPKNLDYSQH